MQRNISANLNSNINLTKVEERVVKVVDKQCKHAQGSWDNQKSVHERTKKKAKNLAQEEWESEMR